MTGLTNKQRLFVEHYLQCWNGTEAARQAGYGGNDVTLASIASENLRKPKIRAEIEARLSTEAMSTNEVLWRLGAQARANIGEFIDVDPVTGEPSLNLKKAEDAGKLHLIKKLKYNARGLPEIELHDQQAALVHIGKHLGLFVETFDHNVTVFDVEEWRRQRQRRIDQVAEMPEPTEGARAPTDPAGSTGCGSRVGTSSATQDA